MMKCGAQNIGYPMNGTSKVKTLTVVIMRLIQEIPSKVSKRGKACVFFKVDNFYRFYGSLKCMTFPNHIVRVIELMNQKLRVITFTQYTYFDDSNISYSKSDDILL